MDGFVFNDIFYQDPTGTIKAEESIEEYSQRMEQEEEEFIQKLMEDPRLREKFEKMQNGEMGDMMEMMGALGGLSGKGGDGKGKGKQQQESEL